MSAARRPSSALGAEVESIVTRVGRSDVGDNLWFGFRVGAELAGNTSLTELFAHAVGTRSIDPDAIHVLDDLATVMALADPQIWPLKIGRLVGSYGGVLAAVAAVDLAFDSDFIGPWTTGHAAKMMVELREQLGPDVNDRSATDRAIRERIERRERLIGFGVPFRPEDERVVALQACMKRRGRDKLLYWGLLEQMAVVVLRERKLPMNIGLGVAAACLDIGFGPEQIAPLTVALMQNVLFANAVEGAAQAPKILRQLPAHTVRFDGHPPRPSPRAEAATATAKTH